MEFNGGEIVKGRLVARAFEVCISDEKNSPTNSKENTRLLLVITPSMLKE